MVWDFFFFLIFFAFLPVLGIEPEIPHLLVMCSASSRNTFQSQVTHVYNPSTWEVEEEAIVSYIVSFKPACLGCRMKCLSTHTHTHTHPHTHTPHRHNIQHTVTTSKNSKQFSVGLLTRTWVLDVLEWQSVTNIKIYSARDSFIEYFKPKRVTLTTHEERWT